MKYEVLHVFHEIILEVRVINSYRAGIFPRFTFFCKFLFETFLHQSCQSLFFPYREFCSVAKGYGLYPGITVGGGLGWWSMLLGCPWLREAWTKPWWSDIPRNNGLDSLEIAAPLCEVGLLSDLFWRKLTKSWESDCNDENDRQIINKIIVR